MNKSIVIIFIIGALLFGLGVQNILLIDKHRSEYPSITYDKYCGELRWHDNNCHYTCINYYDYWWFFGVIKSSEQLCLWIHK